MPRKTWWWEKGEPRVKSHAQMRREQSSNGGGCLSLVMMVISVLVALVALTGCASEQSESGPAPTSEQIVDVKNGVVLRNMEGFRNVVFFCYGTVGVYVTSRGDPDVSTPVGSGIAVLPNDPHCVAQ